ncbi:MAG TPA: hypothetical protein VGK41_07635, partial [Solirubrobacterales bacterium]
PPTNALSGHRMGGNMRTLKILAAVACVSMAALACSTSAAADKLCKAKEAPCSAGNLWPLETNIEATIKSGTEFTLDPVEGTAGLYKCTGSTRSDQLISQGGAGTPIVVTPKQESFSGCYIPGLVKCSATTSGLPESAEWRASEGSPGNGYAEPASTVGSITVSCLSHICEFVYYEQITHTYEGGSPAIERLKARYVYGGGVGFGLCGKELFLEGEREIVSPKSNPVYWTTS